MNNYKEYTNFYVIPRGSDGKLINGSYNRVWKVDKIIGTLNVCNVLMVGEKSDNMLRGGKQLNETIEKKY